MKRLRDAIAEALSDEMGESVEFLTLETVGGGDINEAAVVDTTTGRFFVKWNRRAAADLFAREAESLELMRESGTDLRIPKPLVHREPSVETGRPGFLVMEYLPSGSPGADWEEAYGRGLAQLHRHTADRFGFPHDNYCGTTPQRNDWRDDWVDFYREQRLGHLLELAVEQRSVDRADRRAYERLLSRLDSFLAVESEPPALIHGDLWSGNLHTTEEGRPAILDPAAYFAHREAEFGMITLFGRLPERARRAYDEVWPLKEGWRDRNSLYELYHVMNHYVLFGGHYGERAFRIVRRWVDG